VGTITDITPSLTDVGSINRARTDDGHGDTLGTFTSETRPTDAEATILAGQAAAQVADVLGLPIPDQFAARAKGAAALYGAALVESGANSPRESLMKMWTDMADARLTQLGVEIAEVGAGGQEGPTDNQVMPVYAFPDYCPLPPVF
jgi:hypothetical protein